MVQRYSVQVIRWEPQTLDFEIVACNALEARSIAVKKVHDGDFEFAEIDKTRPIRTTVLRCNSMKENQ